METKLALNLQSPKPLSLNATTPTAVGTTSYERLNHLPKINGVVLSGDKSTADLGIVSIDTAAGWKAKASYVPKVGELCYYTDSNQIKIGDGTSAVKDLSFVSHADYEAITEELRHFNACYITTGTLDKNRLPKSGVTAGRYGQTVDKTPVLGGTFNVPCFVADETGRITDADTKTITLPTYETATSSADGLMSATDKSKLDKMTTAPLASGINMTEDTNGLIFTYIS